MTSGPLDGWKSSSFPSCSKSSVAKSSMSPSAKREVNSRRQGGTEAQRRTFEGKSEVRTLVGDAVPLFDASRRARRPWLAVQEEREMKLWAGPGTERDDPAVRVLQLERVSDVDEALYSVHHPLESVVEVTGGGEPAQPSLRDLPPTRRQLARSAGAQTARQTPAMSYYQRGDSKQDSYAGGGAVVPPLSATNTLVLQAGFAIQGMGDAMKLQVAGEKLTGDRVRAPSLARPPPRRDVSPLFRCTR